MPDPTPPPDAAALTAEREKEISNLRADKVNCSIRSAFAISDLFAEIDRLRATLRSQAAEIAEQHKQIDRLINAGRMALSDRDRFARELAACRAALKPFADMPDAPLLHDHALYAVVYSRDLELPVDEVKRRARHISVGAFRRAALAAPPPGAAT